MKPSVATVQPNELQWTDNTDGTRSATWFGIRGSDGEAFGYGFFLPAGVWDPTHHHNQDATITVVSGELLLEADGGQRKCYPTGAVLFVPAGVWHADGADVDTTIIGTTIIVSTPTDRVASASAPPAT
jgi:quercetin dioxygenase-like cupin family protein